MSSRWLAPAGGLAAGATIATFLLWSALAVYGGAAGVSQISAARREARFVGKTSSGAFGNFTADTVRLDCFGAQFMQCLDGHSLFCATGETFEGWCVDADFQTGGGDGMGGQRQLRHVPVTQCVVTGKKLSEGCDMGLKRCEAIILAIDEEGAPTRPTFVGATGAILARKPGAEVLCDWGDQLED